MNLEVININLILRSVFPTSLVIAISHRTHEFGAANLSQLLASEGEETNAAPPLLAGYASGQEGK
jgi:hypothetical protein